MDINTTIKLNKEFLDDPKNQDIKTVASGWVEIDGIIKFPVNVRRYTDKASQMEKMFVSFPQRKKNDGTYEDVVRPASKEIRNAVEDMVLKNVRAEIVKDMNFPEISNVRVSILKEERNVGSIKVKAIASVNINGFYISGITVKEGKHGDFVQMPQYPDGKGGYKDTVYGITATVQNAIKDSVLYEYHQVLNKPQQTTRGTDVTETQTESNAISPISISGFDFSEKGYLNFVITTDGENLKSRFRIFDPEHEESLKLLSVEGLERHKNIDVLWNSIEISLAEKMRDRKESMVVEHEMQKTLDKNPFDNPEIMCSPRM